MLLRKRNTENMGWHFLNAKKFNVSVKRPTIITFSVRTLWKASDYKKLQINDLRILVGNYDSVPISATFHMTYTHIYDEQLNLVTTFTHPRLSKQWGKLYHNAVIYIFECFANNSNMTVGSIVDILDNILKRQ